MDPLEALRSRRSIRHFQSAAPVPREVILEIVDAGRLAPTANNIQPWEFVIVQDPKTRMAISDLTDYGKFIAEAPVCIVVFCKSTKYALEDGGAATENLLVAATALGLGSCWVAGDKKRYAEAVRKLLGVPEGYRLVSLVCIGISAKPTPSLAKRSVEEVIHWERFS
jgi:nitroreductase